MKNSKYIFLLITLIINYICPFAIPPKIGLIEIQQPDGTILNIKIVGNRDLHFTTTEEGYLLIKDPDGFYRLATLNKEGDLSSSGILPTGDATDKGLKLNHELIERIKTCRTVSTRETSQIDIRQSGLGMYKNNYPTKGNPKVPVILVEFQDVKFSSDYNAKEYFTNIICGDEVLDPEIPGSIKKYFEDQSHGQFVPEFDVYGPITLPYPVAYYGSNEGIQDGFSHYMVSQSLKILDPEVDFSQYDANGDGEIDFVYIIYAGYGENRGADPDTVWPHAGYIKGDADFVIVDGVWGNYYACSNELIFGKDEPEGICAFIHEYLHIVGLPDIYPTDPFIFAEDDWDFTAGQYTILDYGVYNNDGKTPPNLTAFERNALKWDNPIILDHPLSIELQEISSGQFGLIPTNLDNEFYLLENRQQTGWDAFIPNNGMLIWHIDYDKSIFENNQVNNKKDHQHVELIKANNEILFGHPLSNQEGYPFPGVIGNTEFTPYSTPAMVTWTKELGQYPVTNIKETERIISFDIAGGKQGDTGIMNLVTEGKNLFNIYNFNGLKIGNGDEDFVKSLPKGWYIINGEKMYLKN